MDREFGDTAVGASWQAVSSSYANADNTSRLPGYGVLDSAGQLAGSELAFDMKLGNVLDKNYSRLAYNYGGAEYGYREMPFTAMLGVTWTPRF